MGDENRTGAGTATAEPMTLARVREMHPRIQEIIERMDDRSVSLYAAARENGDGTLSALMEREDPSSPSEIAMGFDAFTRALALLDIRTNSDRYGSWVATPLGEAFGREEKRRNLFPEWARRVWAATGSISNRREENERAQSMFLSTDFISGSIQRPYDDDRTLRVQEREPAIPLAEVIARQRTNQGQDYRSRYLTPPAAEDVRMKRVSEASELPRAKITEAARTIRLLKFGRALEASYETLRQQPLDDLAGYIRELAIQTEVDQVSAAADVMINGDGNSGTAGTVINLTTLDPATTANNMTVLAWLAYITQWANPLGLTTVMGRQASILKLLNLAVPNGANLMTAVALAGTPIAQQLTPINTRLAQGTRFGIDETLPADRIVGFDNGRAIERIVEAGSEIEETDRWIHNQTELLTFSFNEAYAVIDVRAVKILRLDA